MMHNVWTVVALAVVIGMLQFLRAGWSWHLALGLVGLLVVGALFPPIGVGIGAVVVLLLLLTTAPQFAKQISGKA